MEDKIGFATFDELGNIFIYSFSPDGGFGIVQRSSMIDFKVKKCPCTCCHINLDSVATKVYYKSQPMMNQRAFLLLQKLAILITILQIRTVRTAGCWSSAQASISARRLPRPFDSKLKIQSCGLFASVQCNLYATNMDTI